MNALVNEEYLKLQTTDSESDVFACVSEIQKVSLLNIFDLERFNSLRKLLRVTAFVQRFIDNCKSDRNERKLNSLTVEELQLATQNWILNVQRSEFHNEINNIANKNQKISIVRQLRLFEDENGLLRCAGRMNNACISELAKYPYLLPTQHKFTRLVVMDAHQTQFHGGINSTVTQLRQYYWIPRIRQCVRNVLKNCVTCVRVSGLSCPTPDPPPLPKDRLQDNIPFYVTGVDFAGPLHIKNFDNTLSKAYICLFTCASTRAVHLEIVSNLTENCFMLAYRRFSSRRSVPRTMISDNATTYVAAAKEITDLTHSTSVQDQLSGYGTTWKFIPRRAPWYGGFWERMIGLTKNCLKKVLGRACVTMENLQTIIIEIEAFLNDRPITYISSDSSDPEPLTPSHLLCGRRVTVLPYPSTTNGIMNESSFNQSRGNINNNFKSISEIISHFRTRWRNEYLTSLREYHKTIGNNNQNIHIGDIVQIHEDNLPRVHWRLGLNDELVYGKDGMVRSVKLRTKNGITNRPIAKLFPLEVRRCYHVHLSTRQERPREKPGKKYANGPCNFNHGHF